MVRSLPMESPAESGSRAAAEGGSGATSDGSGASADRAGQAAAESAAQEQRRDSDGAATTWDALRPLGGGHDPDNGSANGASSGRHFARTESNGSMFASRKGQVAPTGVSFESLYSKLLVHAHDTNSTPSAAGLRALIEESGVRLEDQRIALSMKQLESFAGREDQPLTLSEFRRVVRPNLRFMIKVLNGQLVVPDFLTFSDDLSALAQLVAPDTSGANADYIPPLRDADPEKWGVAACTVDGQVFTHGDVDDYFSIQSSSKPVTYALALAERGEDFVHSYVGMEPSGQPFNAIICLPDKRPHNMCVNVGAIMTAGVLASGHADKSVEQLVQHTMNMWGRLSGNIGEIKFDNETKEAEKSTASNNFALAWFIKARRGLPPNVTLEKMTDFYFSCCSIQATCRIMSIVAATLANGGVCPLTNEEVFTSDIVKKMLSNMTSCGMYDASGQFLYEIGLPAKSGVSGVLISVVPNVMGLATFSPRLDGFGNSVRGVKFNHMLVDCFTFHAFDSISAMHTGCKKDPRFSVNTAREMELSNLRFAIRNGDVHALKFQTLLLETMWATAEADGTIHVEESAALKQAYKDLLQKELQDEDALAIKDSAQGLGLEGIESKLRKLCQYLDDIEREILLEACFAMATADGHMADAEVEVLGRVAAALNVPPTVVELKIFEWKAQLLDAEVTPLQDDSSRRSRDILKRLGSGVPTGEDLYCEERAKEMAAIEDALKTELEQPCKKRHNRRRRGKILPDPDSTLRALEKHGGRSMRGHMPIAPAEPTSPGSRNPGDARNR